jgi:hypothetical protein
MDLEFLGRFTRLAGEGEGWSYTYAGCYQRLLGLADRGWLPVVISDDSISSLKKINLHDLRPEEWRTRDKDPPLPLPPSGKLLDLALNWVATDRQLGRLDMV